MLSKTFLVLILLHVKYIMANFEYQYVQMEVPIEVFEPLMEKYDVISARQCGLVCSDNTSCKGFYFENSVCVGSLIMTSCQLFKPIDESLIPNALSGSVSLLYVQQSQVALIDDLSQNKGNYICKDTLCLFCQNIIQFR